MSTFNRSFKLFSFTFLNRLTVMTMVMTSGIIPQFVQSIIHFICAIHCAIHLHWNVASWARSLHSQASQPTTHKPADLHLLATKRVSHRNEQESRNTCKACFGQKHSCISINVTKFVYNHRQITNYWNAPFTTVLEMQ